ncbi:MAG: hypothetical protein E7660_02190 [Ruminococcaceae bacterium]|nr:hypothetical protein [Oscillospiraceae bacterium]
MKRLISLLLCVILSLTLFCACEKNEGTSSSGKEETVSTPKKEGTTRLTFAESIDIETINSLNGCDVVITGYMATLSPVSGKYMYLMNLPYQSCPYCVPNTNQLSNTIAVYAPEGKTFEFTDSPIEIKGKLETGDFSDEYGYTYSYRIIDATYTTVSSENASEKLVLWQSISDEGLSEDIYAMFDYIAFMSNWTEYTAKFEGGEAYLYPADVAYFQENQFTTESSDTYFADLKARAESFESDKTAELVNIIESAEKLVERAQKQLDTANYTYDPSTDKYTLTYAEEMNAEAQSLYRAYAQWLEYFSLSNAD